MSTTLTIRNLDDNVKQKLRMLAASHQRSMEAEARAILTLAVTKDTADIEDSIASASDAAMAAVAQLRGRWQGRGSTAEMMQILRG